MKDKVIVRIGITVLMILLACGFLLPTVLTVAGSFMSQRELSSRYSAVFSSLANGGAYIESDTALGLLPDDVTVAQYRMILLQTPEYLQKFFNSVTLVVPIALGQIAIASMAAYSLYRCRSRLRSVIYFVYVILMLLPYQATLFPNYLVARQLGTLGSFWAILLPDIWAPFSVFLLTRYMRRIPNSQFEAATLDGAGEWRVFTRIYLPQCKSVLWTIGILIFIDYWNMIEQPMILLDNAAQYPLSIYLSSINANETGIAFAVATLYMIPPLLLFLYGQHHFAEGLGATAAKEKRRPLHWMLPALAAAFLLTLGLLLQFSPVINPHFVQQVTVTQAVSGTVNREAYEFIVPVETIQNDEYGTFVLVAVERADGKSHQIRRVDVTVRSSDGIVSAIAGKLSGFDRIVSTYSAATPPQENELVIVLDDMSNPS